MTTSSLVSFQGPTSDSRCFHTMSKMHNGLEQIPQARHGALGKNAKSYLNEVQSLHD